VGETLDYLKTYAQFPWALRRYRRHTLTVEEAERIVRERMQQRESNFLTLAERSIYGYAGSPYLALLKLAGCELGDLRALIKQQGLEGALQRLREAGVYVTFEEFKARKPIERHGQTIPVSYWRFDNPAMHRVFNVKTSGSSGNAMNVGVDLDFLAARAPDELLAMAALGLAHSPLVRWSTILPGGTLRSMLRDACFGSQTQRWFSPLGLRESRYWLKYATATYYTIFWMRAFGIKVPLPQYVSPSKAIVVARCVAETLHRYGECVLNATVSHCLRVCLAAQEAKLDLTGATFLGGAEAPTPAKVQRIQAAGVRFFSIYAMAEASRIGLPCARPLDATDVHLVKDSFALSTSPHTLDSSGATVPSFNLTTLLPSAPKVMLNVQMGDYGVVEERHCGCDLEECGYTTHLRDVHSYSKLTGEGATLIGNEIGRILEEVLPVRFGGNPWDYQVLEQEDEAGMTRLYLLISPRLHIADEQEVIAVMLKALGDSSSMADAARSVWQRAQTIRVRRMEPILRLRGKWSPLYVEPHTLDRQSALQD
jgi:hypothetical protein